MAKGNFIEYVISDDPNKYPNESEQDGYYYRKVTKVETEEQIVTAGTTPIEVIPSQGKLISKVNINPTPTEEKTVIPTTEDLIVAPVEGKQLSKVTVQGDANFLEENIADGITIWGKTGTHQGGGVPWRGSENLWTSSFVSGVAIESPKSGTYTLTTANDNKPSSKIEYSALPPVYNNETRQWVMENSTIITITNEDNYAPSFDGNMYVRLVKDEYTTDPNETWFLATAISVEGSGLYTKSLAYNAGYVAYQNESLVEYVVDDDYTKYPRYGWKDGRLYILAFSPMIEQYLNFLGTDVFKLKTYSSTKTWDGTLEYSTDGSTWSTWDGTEIQSSIGGKLCLRGTGNSYINNSTNPCFVFSPVLGDGRSLKIYCKGNIENLLDYETVSAGGHPTMANNCYQYMFSGCTSLITAPALPATTLTDSCYKHMFKGCTSLTTVPELPAITLANNCYEGMFSGCTLIKLSTTKTGEYQTEYRIPVSGDGTGLSTSLLDMFANTGGTFTGTPSINTTYYTSNTVVKIFLYGW